MTSTVRVIVADDHEMFREGLAGLLDTDPGIEVVGRAATGEEAVDLVDDARPDVVLMDLHMPGMGGVTATELLRERHPGTAVVALTMLEDAASVRRAVAAGARGYLLKEARIEDVVRAVRAAAAGQAVFGGSITERVLAAVADPGSSRRLIGLTDREEQVLELLARGLTNVAIAERLSISSKTVRNYVSILFDKLGVSDRAAAVARARDMGFGPR